VRKRWKSRI